MSQIFHYFRFQVDEGASKLLQTTNDPTVIASALKLFFRELPEPIIPKEAIIEFYQIIQKRNAPDIASQFQKAIQRGGLDMMSQKVLKYLFCHLKKVSSVTCNKMGAKNLAVVFSPNLIHSSTDSRRPESLISEMEHNNWVIEALITHSEEIFNYLDWDLLIVIIFVDITSE